MDYGLAYEGGSGMGGGGSPPANGGGHTSSSQPSGTRKRPAYDEQTIKSVTVSMMMAAQPQAVDDSSSGLQLPDGRNLYHVQFIAAVRSFDDHSTHVMYQMEDGTGGVISVKQWLDDAVECSAVTDIRRACSKEHVYLKVVGQLKDYDGSKMVLADAIRPLSTANQISHHFLQVVYQGEMHKKGGGDMVGSALPPVGGFAGTTPLANRRGAPLSNNASSGGGNRELEDTLLRTFGPGQGQSIAHVVEVLKGQYGEDVIRKTVKAMSDEGKLYSTIDEDHFGIP